jgi:hypothetical protein
MALRNSTIAEVTEYSQDGHVRIGPVEILTDGDRRKETIPT